MDWLGLPASVSVSAYGAVQGRQGELYYSRHPNKFYWKFQDSPAIEHAIAADQIIGLLPVGHLPDSDYSLLYVENDPATPSDYAADKMYFRTLVLTNPPMDLIKDFTPSEKSFWATAYNRELTTNAKAEINIKTPSVDVILSTKSGQGHAECVYKNLLQPFLKHMGCQSHEVYKTTSDRFISQLCRDKFLPAANAGIQKMIILLSGDGGIVDVVDNLLPVTQTNATYSVSKDLPAGFAKPTFAIMPLGTGNALAHSSNVTKDRTLGVATLLRGFCTDLPIFKVCFSPPARAVIPVSNQNPGGGLSVASEPVAVAHGAVVFSWALHAALVADSDTPAYRMHGVERFQMAGKENLFPRNGKGPHRYRGKVSFQQPSGEWKEVPREEHSYILATLCSRLEEKFMISPLSKPLDGKLRLVHFGPGEHTSNPMTGEQIVELMQKAYGSGKHVQESNVGYEEARYIKLKIAEEDDPAADDSHGGPGRWRRICIDGKIFLCDPGTTIEVSGPQHTPRIAQMVYLE